MALRGQGHCFCFSKCATYEGQFSIVWESCEGAPNGGHDHWGYDLCATPGWGYDLCATPGWGYDLSATPGLIWNCFYCTGFYKQWNILALLAFPVFIDFWIINVENENSPQK